MEKLLMIILSVILSITICVAQNSLTHTVKSGEYLGAIAEKYNVNVDSIKKWNKLNDDRIYSGQKLKIYQGNDISEYSNNFQEPPKIDSDSPKSASSRENISDNSTNSNNNRSNPPPLSYMSQLFFIVIVLIAVFCFRFRNELRKYIVAIFYPNMKSSQNIDYKDNSGELANLSVVNDEVPKLRKEIKQLENRINDLEGLLKNFTMINSSQIFENISNEKININASQNSTLFYADAIIDGFFNRVLETPNEDTVFVISKENLSERIARYNIYIGAYKRVLKNADFLEGCEIQKINSHPTKLEDIDPGETLFVSDTGKWRVTKKLKIKFI